MSQSDRHAFLHLKLSKVLTVVLLFLFSSKAWAEDIEFRVPYNDPSFIIVLKLTENGNNDIAWISSKGGEKESWTSYRGKVDFVGLPNDVVLPDNAPKRVKQLVDGTKDNRHFEFSSNEHYVVGLKHFDRFFKAKKPPGEISASSWDKLYFAGEFYLTTSIKAGNEAQTIVTRQLDGKQVLLNYRYESLAKGVKSADGVMVAKQETPTRNVDLLMFDIESTFVPRGNGLVVSSSDKPVDALSYVDQTFDDFRNKADREFPLTEGDRSTAKQILDNLLSERPSQVVLGGAGTGKTTLVREALRLLPRTWIVKKLDASSLESGTRYTGMKAQRIKAVKAASEAYPIVWFADEIHTLKGAGTSEGNPIDVLESLKTEIADGVVKIIGTDTPMEFFETVTDPAMIRRFSRVEVNPPSDDDLYKKISVWTKTMGYQEQPKAIVQHLIETAKDFNVTENEPSRSIGLLAAAFSKLKSKNDMLTTETVDQAAAVIYKLDPAIRDVLAMRERLRDLPEKLNEVVVGQEQIKSALIRYSKVALANLQSGKGPRLSAYLAGVPGVGKTELAIAYAGAMNLPYKVVEMSRYGHAGRTGEMLIAEIAQQLRDNAFSVIILDEVEKASPKVLESLLTFMSAEKFTSYEMSPTGARTRAIEISARNASVIMTSNAGSGAMQSHFNGLSVNERDSSRAEMSNKYFTRNWLKQTAISAGIPEPLIDRIDIIEPAYPPTTQELIKIIDMHRNKSQSFVQSQMKLEIDYYGISELIDFYLKKSFDAVSSTRDILKDLRVFLMHRSSEIVMHQDFGRLNSFSINLDPRIEDSESITSRNNSCKQFYSSK